VTRQVDQQEAVPPGTPFIPALGQGVQVLARSQEAVQQDDRIGTVAHGGGGKQAAGGSGRGHVSPV
jgi:hypothetical protein